MSVKYTDVALQYADQVFSLCFIKKSHALVLYSNLFAISSTLLLQDKHHNDFLLLFQNCWEPIKESASCKILHFFVKRWVRLLNFVSCRVFIIAHDIQQNG